MRALGAAAGLGLFPGLACTGGGGDTALSASEQQALDIAEYEELLVQTEAWRAEFLDDSASEIAAAGDRLFWLRYDGWDPTLHHWSAATDRRVDYDVSFTYETFNYRVSDEILATVVVDGGTLIYEAWDVARPDVLLGSYAIAAPNDGQKWYAYAAHRGWIYIVLTGEEHTLVRWAPGDAQPQTVTTLESAGAEVGEFWEFGVDDEQVVFVEGGRIWRLDLAANDAEWLDHETQVSGSVQFERDWIAYQTSDGVFQWELATRSNRALSDEIAASDYQMNGTYGALHLHSGGDFFLWQRKLVYEAGNCIWVYDLDSGDITPLLLETRELPRVVYHNPQLLDDGTLFVQALVSESGAIGAEGPVYRVDNPALFQ